MTPLIVFKFWILKHCYKDSLHGGSRISHEMIISEKFYISQFYYIFAGERIVNEREKMVKILKALANPIRLRMIAVLHKNPMHLYALAKKLNLPYPLAHLHLNSLKKLNLVKEIREESKIKGLPTVKYYAPTDFKFILTPQKISEIFKEENQHG